MKTPTLRVLLALAGSVSRYTLMASPKSARSTYTGQGIIRSRRGFARQARMPKGFTGRILVAALSRRARDSTYEDTQIGLTPQ